MKIKHLIEELQMIAHFNGDIDVVYRNSDDTYYPITTNPFVGIYKEKDNVNKNSTFNVEFEDDLQVNAVCIN